MSRIQNKGAEALSRAGSISDLATRLGVNARTISGWRSGAKIPNDDSRAKIERELSIPRRAWGERASPHSAAPRQTTIPASTVAEPDWLWDAAWQALATAHPAAFDDLYRFAMRAHPGAVEGYNALVAKEQASGCAFAAGRDV